LFAKTVQAGIDKPGIDGEEVVCAELEPGHCGRPHIVNEDVGGCREPEQRRPAAGFLQVERNGALVAIALQVHRAHFGMPHRCGVAHHVAIGAFDLDDVGAIVAEDHGRVGTHHHAGQVDDLDAGERSRWRGSVGLFLGMRGQWLAAKASVKALNTSVPGLPRLLISLTQSSDTDLNAVSKTFLSSVLKLITFMPCDLIFSVAPFSPSSKRLQPSRVVCSPASTSTLRTFSGSDLNFASPIE